MDPTEVNRSSRSLFARFFDEHPDADAARFEAFRAEHPARAEALGVLYAELDRLRGLLDLPARSIASHLRELYGPDADPGISLEVVSTDGAVEIDPALVLDHLPEGSGDRRYRVRGEIARGGMGSILKVWDRDLRRHLAMKVALATGASGSSVAERLDSRALARFLEEAQITGQLDHPGVVPVHELGIDSSGRVYFTMRLVRGDDLEDVFRLVESGQQGWTRTRALGVLLKVCEAVAFAHSKGVIHRDLKPSNVMVGRFGEVYVMDWGLAKVIGRESAVDTELRGGASATFSRLATLREELEDEDSGSPVFTQHGEVVGTPAYMPPEQAEGDIDGMGPASDVYSVGAILYRLLAGRRPYQDDRRRQGPHVVLRRVIEGPPAPLRELAPETPVELAAICDKAMARRPGDRYADLEAMGDDLRASLEGRVVAAYHTGPLEELRKWVGRNRALTWTAVGSLVVFVGLLIRTTVVQARANRDLDLTRDRVIALSSLNMIRDDPTGALLLALEIAGGEEDFHSRTATLNAMHRLHEDRTLVGATGMAVAPDRDLVAVWVRPRSPASGESGRLAAWSLGGRDWVQAGACDHLPGERAERRQVFDPSGTQVASYAADGTLWAWDLVERAVIALAPPGAGRAHEAGVRSAVFLDDTTLLSGGEEGLVRVWNVRAGELLAELRAHDGRVERVEIDRPRGRVLTVSGSLDEGAPTDRRVVIWRWERGTLRELWSRSLDEEPRCARFSSDGASVVALDATGGVHVLDASQGGAILPPLGVETLANDVCFALDDSVVVVGHQEGFSVFDVADGEQWRTPRSPHHERGVAFVSQSPDGRLVVTAGHDRVSRVWSLSHEDGIRPSIVAQGHGTWIEGLAWSPGGERFLTEEMGAVHVWYSRGNPHLPHVGPRQAGSRRVSITGVELSDDGHRFFFARDDGVVEGGTFDPGESFAPVWTRSRPGERVVGLFHRQAEGDLLVVWGDGTVERLGAEGGLPQGQPLTLGSPATLARFLGSHGLLAVASRGERLFLVDLGRDPPAVESVATPEPIQCAVLRADGRYVGLGTSEGRVLLYDRDQGSLRSSEALRHATRVQRAVYGVDFHPTRDELVSCGPDHLLRFWSFDLELDAERNANVNTCGRVRYYPDGESLLAAGQWWGSLARVERDADERPQRFQRAWHDNAITGLTMDRARGQLLTTSLDARATLWDLELGQALLTFDGHVHPVQCGDVSADGRWAITGDVGGVVRIWPLDPVQQARLAKPRELTSTDLRILEASVGLAADR